jgi:hypothetical protein
VRASNLAPVGPLDRGFVRPNYDTLVCDFGQAGDDPALSKDLAPPSGAFFAPAFLHLSEQLAGGCLGAQVGVRGFLAADANGAPCALHIVRAFANLRYRGGPDPSKVAMVMSATFFAPKS